MKGNSIKKISILILLSTLALFALSSCSQYPNSQKKETYEIPENSIRYTNLEFGNVIQDGKQAVFFDFVSDYTVTKMEITGTLLDKNENIIHSFDTSTTFSTPSYNPEMPIRIEKELIKNVKSVSFTKIKAYTTEKIDLNKDKIPVLKHIATANESTISNCRASGSTITITNGEINIHLDENSCGFRWDLSEANLKPNTKYLIKFENVYAADINSKSIQLETTWVDSTYRWPRYYHVNGKRFDDIISSGEIISNEYYQFLTSKTYDEYTMEFSFSHSVDNSKNKAIYFNLWGIKNQLSIEKLSIYEIMYE